MSTADETPAPSGTQPSSRWGWTAVAVAWLASVAGLTAWLAGTSTLWLRQELRVAQFWSLEAAVIAGLAMAPWILREVGRSLEWRDHRRMAMLAALAIGLTLLVAPRTNRLFYDEQIYQSIGQNLADLKQAQVCNDGRVEYGRLECQSGEYNKQPYAYPHLLSLTYRLFGVRPGAAFIVNAVVMAATVCGLYLLVLMLFNDRAAAFLAALVMALIPEQLIWSATAAVEPSASLACVVALLAAANAARSTTTVSLAAAAVAAAYAIQFRPESLFILPVAGLLLWRRLAVEWRATRLYWVGLLLLALTATHIGHLAAVRGEGWGTSEARFSLNYLGTNLRVNGWFYLWDGRFPPLFTVLALVGLPGQCFRTARISLLIYFLVFFGIDLLFYAGSYNYGADVRYSLMTYPPLAALAGVGAARLVRGLSSLAPPRWVRCSIPAALTFQLMWYAPLVRAITEEAWAARADVRFASTLKPILAGNSYVLTQNPGMFQVWGINAGQMSLVVQSPGYLDVLASRYAGGVYVHWNFWCNVQDAVQPAICRKAMASGPLELVREYRERDQRYALYRFTRSSS